MLEKSVARENSIRELIKTAQEEKAELDARVEEEKASLFGKAKAALLAILEMMDTVTMAKSRQFIKLRPRLKNSEGPRKPSFSTNSAANTMADGRMNEWVVG